MTSFQLASNLDTSNELSGSELFGQPFCLPGNELDWVETYNSVSNEFQQACLKDEVEDEEDLDDYLTDTYSDLAEQYEWQERLEKGNTIHHCCTSCVYFCRNYRPPIHCAVHPYGIGVDTTTPNECADWELADVSWALMALEEALLEDCMTVNKQWKILRLAYPYSHTVEALVQVDQQLHCWEISDWTSLNGSLSEVDVYYGYPCWKNLGDNEAYVVWIHPDLHHHIAESSPSNFDTSTSAHTEL